MRAILILTFAALGGCSIPKFTKAVQLGGLRILTIQADQPEVNAGAPVNVQITPVVSDLGAGRTVTATVQTCIDPGVSVGHLPVCDNPDFTTQMAVNTANLGPAGTNVFTGAAPAFNITVPANPSNYAIAPAWMQFNGMAYLVIYTLTATDGTSVTAFKRIIVSSNPTKNNNPAIGNIFANGTQLNATNQFSNFDATLELGITFTGVAAETYQIENPDGSMTSQPEDLVTTWFYSDGSTKYDRTSGNDGNEFNMPGSHPAGRAVVLVVVTHDGRGGEDFKVFTFN